MTASNAPITFTHNIARNCVLTVCYAETGILHGDATDADLSLALKSIGPERAAKIVADAGIALRAVWQAANPGSDLGPQTDAEAPIFEEEDELVQASVDMQKTINALRAKLAAYERGDDVDRVGRVVRRVETWTAGMRRDLVVELTKRYPETWDEPENQLRAKLEAAEKVAAPQAVKALEQIAEHLRGKAEKAEAERDAAVERAEKAEANYRFMVERAADGGGKLDGYRELGARLAASEERADSLRADVERITRERDTARDHSQTANNTNTGLTMRLRGAETDLTAARARIAAMTPVVEAADAVDAVWRSYDRGPGGLGDVSGAMRDLRKAVDAYRAQRGAT